VLQASNCVNIDGDLGGAVPDCRPMWPTLRSIIFRAPWPRRMSWNSGANSRCAIDPENT
jgi:hypothetical protein